MSAHAIVCWSCQHQWEYSPPLSRFESCPQCGWDARVCQNCKYYDRSAYRECVEEQAEWVRDKDKNNFCAWFIGRASVSADLRGQAENPLDALFGKSETSKPKSKIEEELDAFFKKS